MAVAASEAALSDAGLLDHPVIKCGRTGAAYGSSFGSPDAVLGFYELKMNGASRHLNATTYIQMMSHTALVNIGLFFGVTGRMIPTSSACTSGSQAIGYACEAIRMGKADVMIAGGPRNWTSPIPPYSIPCSPHRPAMTLPIYHRAPMTAIATGW